MEQPKEYYAFISYKREDKKEAKRLQHALEYYRLPNHLRQENLELPEYVRPVFRDMTDLEVGELSAQIHSALEQSHFLIVTCSPRAATSKWVNDEVEYFISLGKQDKIIPYIIEGVPHASNPSEECYPPSLLNLSKEKELLGANINEVGKDSATIRVVSRMFNIRFDTLYQRYEREQRRKRWMWIGGALLIAFVAIVIASIFFNLNRVLKSTIDDRNNALHIADSALIQVRKDSVVLADHLKRIIRDSLTLEEQKNSIKLQKDEIATERDNVKSANYAMQVNLSRILAEKASALVDEGDSYLARLLALEALPPKCQYTSEAERAFRKACQKIDAILYGHTGPVLSAVFSPDGKRIASASYDKTIRIWDVMTGKQIGLPLFGHTSSVSSVVFSHNGKHIASSSWDNTIRIWNAETGLCVDTLLGHTSLICSVAFSPDGKRIASGAQDKTIRIWDVDTGLCLDTLLGHTKDVRSVVYSPDGNHIITASYDRSIRKWNVNTKQQEILFTGDEAILSMSISPDGQVIAFALNDNDNTICMLNSNTREQICQPIKDHKSPVYSVSFSPDGKYVVSASYDKTVRIWDASTGWPIRTLKGHTGNVESAVFSPDSKLVVSASMDGTVRIWDFLARKEMIEPFIDSGDGRNCHVLDASFSPDGRSVLSAACNVVRIWDVTEKEQMGMPLIHPQIIRSAVFSPDGKFIVTASDDGIIRLWDAKTRKREGKDMVGHAKDRIYNTCIISSIAFSSDGRYLVSTASDKTIRVWDIETCSQVGDPMNYTNVNSAIFSPNGKYIVTASLDKSVIIWDAKTGDKIRTLLGHGACVNSASFSSDGKHIISSASDRTIIIWDVKTGDSIRTIREHNNRVASAFFSPDNKYIVSSSNSIIRIWDARTGKNLQTFIGHNGLVHTASFSPDGKSIVSASNDGTVRIWDCTPLQELIESTNKRFKDRQLTSDERRKYYLE